MVSCTPALCIHWLSVLGLLAWRVETSRARTDRTPITIPPICVCTFIALRVYCIRVYVLRWALSDALRSPSPTSSSSSSSASCVRSCARACAVSSICQTHTREYSRYYIARGACSCECACCTSRHASRRRTLSREPCRPIAGRVVWPDALVRPPFTIECIQTHTQPQTRRHVYAASFSGWKAFGAPMVKRIRSPCIIRGRTGEPFRRWELGELYF